MRVSVEEGVTFIKSKISLLRLIVKAFTGGTGLGSALCLTSLPGY